MSNGEVITSLTVKKSFEQRAKRLGIATTKLESAAIGKEQLEVFRDCEFWIWDKQQHELAYRRTKGRCCFQHLIKLPVKNDVSHSLYPWQKEIFDALQQHKLIAILKARGIGASEFLLRYAMWLCVKDNKMRGKNMAVVTGIREDLSLELLRRFRNLMPDMNWNTRESIAEIDGGATTMENQTTITPVL
jgi:hypothetical protein